LLVGGKRLAVRRGKDVCLYMLLPCINDAWGIRRTKHAVFGIKYHLVWIPKYRKNIFNKEVSGYVKGIFEKIAEEYEFRIDTMEVMEDHVHVFIEVPPR